MLPRRLAAACFNGVLIRTNREVRGVLGGSCCAILICECALARNYAISLNERIPSHVDVLID